MAEIFKFFNSAPGDERWHYASDFADYFANVLSSGLLHKNGSPNLQVKVNAGTMQTYIEAGEALIQGYQYQNTLPLFLTHGLPEPNLDRIDRIVLRLDKRNNARYIRLFVKEGVSATNPVPPTLQRDQYVFELSLAQIRLTKNTSSLEPLKLVDERMKEDLCGIVYSLISVPTSVFQQQWDYWFNNKKQTLENDLVAWQIQQKNEFEIWQAEQEQEFLTWFESIKDILSGDVAANLAARIAELEQTVGPLKQTVDTLGKTVDTHLADVVKHNNYGIATGSNALSVTLPKGPTTLLESFTLRFKNTTANTGAVTLNVNGLGAKPIVKNGGAALSSGSLKAGGIYTVCYSGTAFILQGEGSEFDVGDKIPASKVTAGWRSQWTASNAYYGGSFHPAVDKDGNVYIISGPDSRNNYTVTVTKYSKTGTLLKQITINDNTSYQPSGLNVSPDGSYIVFATGGIHDTFIQLYSSELELIKKTALGNFYQTASPSCPVVTNKGDAYIALRRYNSGSTDTYEVKKYAKAGYEMWSKSLADESIVDLILLSDGNIAVSTERNGMKVHKISGVDTQSNVTITWSYLTDINASYMGNLAELTNGDIAVVYSKKSGNSTLCWVQAIMTNGQARPAGYISLGSRLGTQYNGLAKICSDGNGGVYFGLFSNFYWGWQSNVTLDNVKALIYGRLGSPAGPMNLAWCHIYTQDTYSYSDAIGGIAYDALTDSVISTHSDGSYSNGNVRKWDWYVSLK
ncbi:hypothetical protein [Lysinibacillus sp. NPDC093688]|uniref:hypothetical protein n=1 Tax=Lysinibacillus sp. NPDC093688 TaxID=3390577 RepID=UPI003CFCEB66